MKQYLKAGVAVLATVATWGVTAGADGTYDQVELWGLLGAVAAALGTYFTPYHPAEKSPEE